MDRYPWRNTSEDIADGSPSQWETPGGAQQKADKAEQNSKEYTDGKNQHFDEHIADTTIHVTEVKKTEWDNKAPGSVATDLTNHIADPIKHVTQIEHDKLNGVADFAEVNQNAFSSVNDVIANSKTDALTLFGGIGITVSTSPASKKITITATGNATPGAHGSSHDIGGPDPIPDLTNAVNMSTDAQTKANEVQTNLNSHKLMVANSTNLGHVKVDGTTIVADSNGTISSVVKGGVQATTANITYFVNASTGNDTNNGLTAETAFKTIQYAINVIPQVVNHSVIIGVAAGTYAESIVLSGFVGGGNIAINGANVATTTHNVNGFNLSGCTVPFLTRGFNIVTTDTIGVRVTGCTCVDFLHIVNTTTVAGSYGFYISNSLAVIRVSTISNKANAIYANSQSTVSSSSNLGTGNSVALTAVASSTIGKNGTQPAAVTAESASNGGVIR